MALIKGKGHEAQSLTPEARLARQLLRLSVTRDQVKVRQSDLVTLLGMSRSNLRRALKAFVGAGILETGYGRIAIVDRPRLQAVSRRTN